MTSRPRPRGDLPELAIMSFSRIASSPPARGSSAEREVMKADLLVVPARAGIFPRGGGR
ncbi:hypothetical protein FRAAL0449 [Frankia alni ACN14a]|nr:hypothetical protein FRAAL0449 [Frankia alni ACN14a]